MKVRDMVASISWGQSMYGVMPCAHMLATTYGDGPQRAYCGVFVKKWDRSSILDAEVCKRCLKATEKYA